MCFLYGVINSPERSTCGVGDLGGFLVGDLEHGLLWELGFLNLVCGTIAVNFCV